MDFAFNLIIRDVVIIAAVLLAAGFAVGAAATIAALRLRLGRWPWKK